MYRHASGRQFLGDLSPPLGTDCAIALTSAAKFVTNIAALQLVERGLLTLNEPINRHIPEIDKCLRVEKVAGAGQDDKPEVELRRPGRDVTLRHLLLYISGLCTGEAYEKYLGSHSAVPPIEFPEDAHYLLKMRSTHLFFEPGEGFDYGWSIYYVQLLVERLGGKRTYVEYANDYIFRALGMTTSTYGPAESPKIWERRLQMVRRVDGSNAAGKSRLVPCDEATQGITCSISDIARLFSGIMSPDCKLLRLQEHRDMLFEPQLEPGSPAHTSFMSDPINYGFLLPLQKGVSEQVSWSVSPRPKVNWTALGTVLEEDDTLPGLCIPRGTVTFEGMPNVIWTINREKGRAMLFGNQILPVYDVEAHNMVTKFMRTAWKTFG